MNDTTTTSTHSHPVARWATWMTVLLAALLPTAALLAALIWIIWWSDDMSPIEQIDRQVHTPTALVAVAVLVLAPWCALLVVSMQRDRQRAKARSAPISSAATLPDASAVHAESPPPSSSDPDAVATSSDRSAVPGR